MAFEVLTQQIRAITQVAGSFTGQVGSYHQGLLAQHAGSPLLSGQLMLADALKLIAVIDTLPSMEEYSFEVVIGTGNDLAFEEVERLFENLEKTREDIRKIDEIIRELETVIGAMKNLVSQIMSAADYLSTISQTFEQKAATLEQTQHKIRQTVIPEMQEFIKTLEEMLHRYMAERIARAEYIRYQEQRFKPYLPLAYGMKVKRQGEHVEDWVLLGAAGLATEFYQWDKMLRLLRRYMKQHDHSPESFVRAITVPLRRHKFSYALKLVEEGSKMHPTKIAIPRLVADSYYARERFDEERNVWETWVEQHPDKDQAQLEIAGVYAERGNAEQTMAWTQELIHNTTHQSEAWLARARAHWNADERDEKAARAALDEYVKASKKTSDAKAQILDEFGLEI